MTNHFLIIRYAAFGVGESTLLRVLTLNSEPAPTESAQDETTGGTQVTPYISLPLIIRTP